MVEILITLVVMTVLLTLGTVGVRSTLVNARDAERQEDISVLARGLELYYDKGGIDGSTKGSYPSYNELWNGAINVGKSLTPYSIGSSDANWRSPSNKGIKLLCIFESPSGYWATQPGCETPGITSGITSRLTPDTYGYEPIDTNGNHCYNPGLCPKYNLYWIDEASGALKVHKSRHQR